MNESLSNRQMAFLLFGVVLGYGVISLPKNIAEAADTGAWLSIFISTLIVVIFTYILTYLGYIFKDKTIYEYGELLLGKYIASFFILIYIIYFFLFFTMVTRLSSEMIKLTILLKTPIWFIALLLLSTAYYAITKRLVLIARISELYGIFIIIFFIIIHFLMATEGRIINLRPFFGTEDIFGLLKSTLVTAVPFEGYEILAIVAFNKNNSREVFKYTTIMMFFIGMLYIFITETCIAIVGVDDIVNYNDAVLVAIRRLELPYLEFLRRLDALFLVGWIMALFCTITIFGYGCIFLLGKWLKNMNFNVLALIVMTSAYGIILLVGNFERAKDILEYTGYLGLLPAGVIPLILFIAAKVKKYDKKKV